MHSKVGAVGAACFLILSATPVLGQTAKEWFRDGQAAVARAKKTQPITGKARNVILFVGDGMGVSTVTASRILEGQQRGESGEENLLSFEKFPYTALVKTYTTDMQTPDSAGTMNAMVTGVKTKGWMLGLTARAKFGDVASASGNELTTILDLAERGGLATGIVTTTRLTHATPAALYAHTPDRHWEDDGWIPATARMAGAVDVARQFIEYDVGDGLEVALGGGRGNFRPSSAVDPEDPAVWGHRADGRDLTEEWTKRPRSAYVWNRAGFDAIDPSTTDHLLGLFQPSHMRYEHDRLGDSAGEPSLSEMTVKALDLLARNKKGFFLMVEGGRIDHAHHSTNAYRALVDTIEFAKAVSVAVRKTDRRETLIIVTADHSHVFTIAGYAQRGQPILGIVESADERFNEVLHELNHDAKGKRFSILGYANGPGALCDAPRPVLTNALTTAPDYRQEATVRMAVETHGGEDVPLYADGPQAHLFRGVIEQNVIFHVMVDALGLKAPAPP